MFADSRMEIYGIVGTVHVENEETPQSDASNGSPLQLREGVEQLQQ